MIEFTDQQEPIHHITITRGSEKTHFWYFLASPDVKLFDGTLDKKFVELLHVESSKLNIGEHVLFISSGLHVQRRTHGCEKLLCPISFGRMKA